MNSVTSVRLYNQVNIAYSKNATGGGGNGLRLGIASAADPGSFTGPGDFLPIQFFCRLFPLIHHASMITRRPKLKKSK